MSGRKHQLNDSGWHEGKYLSQAVVLWFSGIFTAKKFGDSNCFRTRRCVIGITSIKTRKEVGGSLSKVDSRSAFASCLHYPRLHPLRMLGDLFSPYINGGGARLIVHNVTCVLGEDDPVWLSSQLDTSDEAACCQCLESTQEADLHQHKVFLPSFVNQIDATDIAKELGR